MVSVSFEETYGYTPTKYVTIILLVLFSISTIAHARQWCRFPLLVWPVLGCGLIEVIGWASRLASSLSPDRVKPFEIQLIAILIGPTPLAHAILNLLQGLIDALDIPFSYLSYYIVISGLATAAFCIQLAGGAIIVQELQHDQEPSYGVHLMFAGTIIHLATMSIQCLLSLWRFIRYIRIGGKAWRSLRVELGGLLLAVACILTRTSFRVAELRGGLYGRLATTEVYFNVLDGTMMIVAMAVLNYAVPLSINFLKANQQVILQSLQKTLEDV